MKEQQVEAWEEKLAQRASSVAESSRILQQRRNGLGSLVNLLQQQGGRPPAKVQELFGADPTLASPHLAGLRSQAEEARRAALDARMRAAQAWEEDLARQANALNAVLQGIAQAQAEIQGKLDELERAKAEVAEPVMLVKSRSGGEPVIPTAPPKPPAPSARPVASRNGPESRVHSRAKLRVQVDFESDHNFFTGFSSDISEGGLFVATVNIQPLGSPVEVAFALPTGEQIMARGSVRWIREASDRDHTVHAGMGIQFEHLTEDARDAVHSFITQRDPIFYDD